MNDVDDFLDRVNEIEKAMKDIKEGKFDNLPPEIIYGFDSKSADNNRTSGKDAAQLRANDDNRIIMEQEEAKMWWERARARNSSTDFDCNSDDETGMNSELCEETTVQDEFKSLSALKTRYNLDYSRWDQKWSKIDPASISEEEESSKRKQDEEMKQFELSNPGFCNQFKADSDKREVETRREESKSQSLREQGNKKFSERRYNESLGLYLQCLKLTPFDTRVLTNIASSWFHLNLIEKSIEFCDRALYIDRKYIKAYHRRCQCRQLLGLYHLCCEDAHQFNQLSSESDWIDAIDMKRLAVDKDKDKLFTGMFNHLSVSTRTGLMNLMTGSDVMMMRKMIVVAKMMPYATRLIRISGCLSKIVDLLVQTRTDDDTKAIIQLLILIMNDDDVQTKLDLIHNHNIIPLICNLSNHFDLISILFRHLLSSSSSSWALTHHMDIILHCLTLRTSSDLSSNIESTCHLLSSLSHHSKTMNKMNESLFDVISMDLISLWCNQELNHIHSLIVISFNHSEAAKSLSVLVDFMSKQHHQSYLNKSTADMIKDVSEWIHDGSVNSPCLLRLMSCMHRLIPDDSSTVLTCLANIISSVLHLFTINHFNMPLLDLCICDVSWLLTWYLALPESSNTFRQMIVSSTDISVKLTKLLCEISQIRMKRTESSVRLLSSLFQVVSKLLIDGDDDDVILIQLTKICTAILDQLSNVMIQLKSMHGDDGRDLKSIRSSIIRILVSVLKMKKKNSDLVMDIISSRQQPSLVTVLLSCLPQPECDDSGQPTAATVYQPYKLKDNRWTTIDSTRNRPTVDYIMCGNVANCIIGIMSRFQSLDNHPDLLASFSRVIQDVSHGNGIEKLVSLFSNVSQGPVRKNSSIALAKLALADSNLQSRLRELNGLQILQQSEMQGLIS